MEKKQQYFYVILKCFSINSKINFKTTQVFSLQRGKKMLFLICIDIVCFKCENSIETLIHFNETFLHLPHPSHSCGCIYSHWGLH